MHSDCNLFCQALNVTALMQIGHDMVFLDQNSLKKIEIAETSGKKMQMNLTMPMLSHWNPADMHDGPQTFM